MTPRVLTSRPKLVTRYESCKNLGWAQAFSRTSDSIRTVVRMRFVKLLVARLTETKVIFFKTRPPVMPVQIVHEICGDTAANPNQRKSRFVKRLTPITLMGKATEKGLEEVANAVLAPHFHKPEQKGIKVWLAEFSSLAVVLARGALSHDALTPNHACSSRFVPICGTTRYSRGIQ